MTAITDMNHTDVDEQDLTAEADAYYNRPFSVRCQCGREAEAPENELKLKGWRLGQREWCPPCAVQEDIWQAGIALGRAQHLNDSLPEVEHPLLVANLECPF